MTARCTGCYTAELKLGHILLTGLDAVEQYLAIVKLAQDRGWSVTQRPDGELDCICPVCASAKPVVVVLPAYAAAIQCPKCGQGEMTTKYCAGGPPPACSKNHPVEHLHRTCPQCGYDMITKTKDQG